MFLSWFHEHYIDSAAIKPTGYWDFRKKEAVPPSPKAIERFNKRYPYESSSLQERKI